MSAGATPLSSWAGHTVAELRALWQLPELRIYASLSSTSDEARSMAAAGAPALSTVIADEQTAGRGQFGRSWIAAKATSLLLSVILRPAGASGAAPSTIPLRLGLAAARAVRAATGIDARLKWPNDILAPDRRKLGGILCEASSGADGTFVIAGIGLNANQEAGDWPPDLRLDAASLRQVSGEPVDRARLAGDLLAEIRSASQCLDRPLGAAERAAWADRDALFGHPLLVDGRAAGSADGITADGALRLRTPDGVRILWSGTVRLAAPRGREEVAP